MRRGFSSTEVIVCTAIFALALVPIITMITSGTKPAAYNEYHLVAQSISTYLADRVSEVILSKGFGELETMAVGDRVNIQDTKSYRFSLDEIGVKTPEGSALETPQVFLTNLSDAGAALVQISVVVTWTLPLGRRNRTFSLERLLSRPDCALSSDYTPRPQGVRVSR